MVKNLLNIFFPEICYACSDVLSDNEDEFCTSCRHQLPVTDFHLQKDNLVEKVFFGRVKLEAATALFRFHKKGVVQNLIHNLKYKGRRKIGSTLGKWLGQSLSVEDRFKSVQVVIPVPIHAKKLKERGFNQVAPFAKEIARKLNIRYSDDILVKTTSTTSQVFKKRFARWQDSDSVFSLQNSHEIEGKHILLVDDIVTTGATIEACAQVLQQADKVKISVATMAIAQ